MRVYVESNFILELVLQQEETGACEALRRLAESQAIELVIPAYALLEPHNKIIRTQVAWREFRERQGTLLRDLRRSTATADVAERIKQASDLFLVAEKELEQRYTELRASLIECATLLTIDGAALRDAEQVCGEFDLKLPDGLILACILADARTRPAHSLFLNRNTRDFDDVAIIARLRRYNCVFKRSFADGLASLRNEWGVL